MKRIAKLTLCLLARLAEVEAAKPNVLFIVIDDMNDWISLLDPQSPIKTPNLERLAKRGTLFTNAYCISAACNPSRVATLTGLRPSTSGVYGNKSDWRKALPRRQTLMQQFQLAGYAVRGAGKIFHHQFNGAFHDEASFGDFLPMAPQNMPPKKLNQATKYGSRNTDWGAWPSDEKNTIDFRTTEYCIRSLKTHPIDKPLFLACGIFKPHSPFFAPPKYHAKLPEIPSPTRLDSDWSDLPSGALKLMQNKKWFWNGMSALDKRIPGSYDDFVRAYAACCLFADAQVGRLLDALDRSPIAKNTIIVFWSDHGFKLGEHSLWHKHTNFELDCRVPFMISAPGYRTGQRTGSLVELLDIFPTLCDLAGLPIPDDLDGTSLMSILKNPETSVRPFARSQYPRGNNVMGYAIKTDRFRYVEWKDTSSGKVLAQELYDHFIDGQENVNQAGNPSYRSEIEKAARYLRESKVR